MHMRTTRSTVRLFLFLEGVSFVLAALIHSGVLPIGVPHLSAAIAESLIGTVLLVALALTVFLPDLTHGIGIVAQSFALLGTLVGVFTIAIGVGPRTLPDLIYHATILLVLTWGLGVALRVSGARRRYSNP
jgi:hypothetical protein